MSKGRPRITLRLDDDDIARMTAEAAAATAPAVGDAAAVTATVSDAVRASWAEFMLLPQGRRTKAIRDAVRNP